MKKASAVVLGGLASAAPVAAGLTVFLKSSVDVPEDWDLSRTFLTFGFDLLEGLLFIDDVPWSGLDRGRSRCPAPRSGPMELMVEFDSVPRVRVEPHLAQTTGGFDGGAVVGIDRDVEAAFYDFRFAFETFKAMENQGVADYS